VKEGTETKLMREKLGKGHGTYTVVCESNTITEEKQRRKSHNKGYGASYITFDIPRHRRDGQLRALHHRVDMSRCNSATP
jgi:hypothetical protein